MHLVLCLVCVLLIFFRHWFLLLPVKKVGDALIAINNVSVQGLPFNHTMHRMKKSLREDPCIVLRFRTMEERYRLLRMKVR